MVRNFWSYGTFFYSYLGCKLFLVWGCLLLASLLESLGVVAILPVVMRHFFKDSVASDGVDRQEQSNSTFFGFIDGFSVEGLLALLLGLFFCKAMLTFFALTIAAYSRALFFEKLKFSIFNKIMGTKYHFFSGMPVGRYITLINEQASITLVAFKSYLLLLGQFVTALVYIIASAFIDPLIVFVGVALGVLAALCLRPVNRYIHGFSKGTADSTGMLGSFLSEVLHGLGYLKATNSDQPARNIVRDRIHLLRQFIFRTGVLVSATSSVREPIALLGICGILWYELSVYGVVREELLAMLFLMYRSLNSVMQIQLRLQGFLASAGAIDCVIREERELDLHQVSVPKPLKFSPSNNDDHVSSEVIMSIRGVNLEVAGKKIFSSLDMDLTRGEVLAIVGPSGGGKTTLLNLILGLVQPCSGSIHYFDAASAPIGLDAWRSSIGYCPQEGVIFEGTVASNILMMDPNHIDAPALEKAEFWASRVGLFQKEVGKGNVSLTTEVGYGGMKLSGGQRQRLSIARELAKEPQLLIFDEPTSALDAQSRSQIAHLVDELSQSTTTVIVTHHLDEWKNVTRVFDIRKARP